MDRVCKHGGMVDRQMTKSIGEHWVCSELARRGWAPALTRDGIERTDILAVGTLLEDRPRVEVQVKSATQNGVLESVRWPLGKLVPQFSRSDAEWVVLVSIPVELSEPPVGFVVPRDHVSAGAYIDHKNYVREGEGSRQLNMERSHPGHHVFAGYRARWDLLERPATECPVLLPPGFEELACDEEIGVPTGHPWIQGMPAWGE